MSKFYVTLQDTFLSGWGQSEGKTNILVFHCKNLEQAEIVERNAKDRTDTRLVRITETYPRHSPSTHFVQDKTIKDYPTWYELHRPFKQ